ncbi:MAG: DNA methyltransferase [Candidatus Aenigmatarchaeota archaeon]
MKSLDEIYDWGEKFLEEKLDWAELATFTPNKNDPVYNWFYYKEGFAKELVLKMIEMFGIKNDNKILDPFCGSGTTLLACKQLGINSIGLDVLPISVFASEVKTRNYNSEILHENARNILSQRFVRKIVIINPFMKRMFSPYAREDIIFFKEKLHEVRDLPTKNFLLLGLIKAAMRVSWVWKDGGVLKIKKQNSSRVPLRKMYKNVLKSMIRGTEEFQSKPCNTEVAQGDARNLRQFEDSTFDAVITSPPYLNNIDYTKVYTIENWFINDIIKQEPPLRSHIGLDKDTIEFMEDFEIPASARAYFCDMNQSLQEIYRVCKDNANIGLVVGNAYLDNEVIESDIILAYLAEKIGFKIEKILVLNKRAALVNRTEKVGTLRESLVWIKK